LPIGTKRKLCCNSKDEQMMRSHVEGSMLALR